MSHQTFEKQELELGPASVRCDGNALTISTGEIERTWELSDYGMFTRCVADLASGKVWQEPNRLLKSDWLLPVAEEARPNGWISPATLGPVTITQSDDEQFTSPHLAVAVTFTYPRDKIAVRWTAWAYPGAPGIRTQLFARALPGFEVAEQRDHSTDIRCDTVPVVFDGTTRHMIGLYGGTQVRNDTYLDLMQEESRACALRSPEFCHWANALCVEHGGHGIALVKESHKFANQNGCDGGQFVCDPASRLMNHGWGLMQSELTDQFQPGWATWCLTYAGGEVERQRAFKRFDLIRYPMDPARDIYVQANTWGSSYDWLEHREAASETNVLKELDSCADLGIDVLQIDDGWQGNDYEQWVPHPDRYPEGWKNVKARAEELGIRLGLWAAAVPVGLDDLNRSWADVGFVSYKLDFAILNKREQIEALMAKTRKFIAHTGHTVRINWDLTEVVPRYGYFFAREYGHVYLENRKPVMPKGTTYRPHTVLRDLWQLSAYVNLLKFQGSVQNVDHVNRGLSDAWMHPHDYCLAITLMSTPLFFQQTLYYDEPARKQLRPLLKVYKEHRDAIYRGIVYPIGAKPDNASWPGFQSHDHQTGVSYLTIFRELNNDEPTKKIRLNWHSDQSLVLTDLMTGESRPVQADTDGAVEFEIPQTPGYRFMRCQPR